MILKFNKDWTEDQQVELSEALSLTEKQEERLFADEKPITLNDEQAAAYENWTKKSKDNDGGDVAPVASVAVASGIMSKAIEMEKKIEGNAEIDSRVRLTIKSGEELKRGPFVLCDLLRKTYGKEGMASFPEVGSPFKDPDDGEGKRYLPCNNPDRYTVQRDGKKGKVNEPRSFYADYAGATAYGKDILSVLQAINDAKDVFKEVKSYKTVKPFTLSGETIDFANMNNYQVAGLASTWNGRWSKTVSAYKQSIRLDRQLNKAEEMASITLHIARGKDGTIIGTYPITIANKENPAEFSTYTPTNFLSLDFDKAVANGGTYADLIATVGKGANNEPALLAARIKSASKAAEYIAELAAWFEVDGNAKDFQLYLNSKDNAGKFVHDDAVLSTGKLNEQMDSAATKQSARYAALCEAAALAATKQAA